MQRLEEGQEEVQRQPEAESEQAAVGPVDALPAWRPFYAAVRDAMQRLRAGEADLLNSGNRQDESK
ncbi:Mg2+ transporter protein, CorA family protein [Paenibacillus curdlanolyticus YK9]|uniref:Mg2+ transporter protein, CorA family protein n=1 Tax=Paenibacillus curdlanolyticus YK9 TaxID=717606 RepID=E0IF90_9BACL|nr:hypothetical protein [Paenibacillus curdlanolyticus]EFM08866.1 Mg2+ transporter protein, CorA family protein [Paenibacillus curdlanolyticus YK9]